MLHDHDRVVPVVILALSLASLAHAEQLPPVPSTSCPLVAAAIAPQIDGKLDDPAWSKAELQTTFQNVYRGPGHKNDFRLLSDGDWLYVAVTAYEPDIPEQNAEHVLVCIAPHKASDQWVTFAVAMNAQGIAKCEPGIVDGDDSEWHAVFRQHPDRWVLELAIRTVPVFGTKVTKGQAFDFNLARTRTQVVGDDFDIYHQWSHTGLSSGARYRFGEVTIGNPADRIPGLRGRLQHALEAAGGKAGAISADARKAYALVEADGRKLLKAAPGKGGSIASADVRAYEQSVKALERELRRVVLADRGVIVWSCNPMAVPLPAELPPVDVPDARRLDIRVLANEWESAAVLVTNLTAETLDGQVLLTDFVTSDGKTRAPGWDVLQVRTAPLYKTNTGRKVRDPLPQLQEGDLFRVAPDENELLWLTFKSRGLAPGRYQSTMTVRSLDDRVRQEVALTLRVYPLALGAEGRPHVNVWNRLFSGKDWAERAAHCRDYYITACFPDFWPLLPHFTADADGNITDGNLDFGAWDGGFDEYAKSNVDTYLVVLGWHNRFLWPAKREDDSTAFNVPRWSPKFNELFAKWTIAFHAHMNEKGLAPDRWAFYIMDEPPPGENRQEVISFARQLRQVGLDMRTYITFPVSQGTDEQNLELSRYVNIVQVIGDAKPKVIEQIQANAKEFWRYSILLRGNSPLLGYRKGACWDRMQEGCTGTGFYQWDSRSPGDFLWRDSIAQETMFSAIYTLHDNTIIPSLRAEAFREGIEDWKYLLMLDEALARCKKRNVAAKIVAEAAAYRKSCLLELDDAKSAYRFRDTMRGHLIELHAALGEVDLNTVKSIEQD
jgi:hypothetical protein